MHTLKSFAPLRVVAVAALLTACFGESAAPPLSNVRIRFVHAIPDTAALDARVNAIRSTGMSAVGYGVATGYDNIVASTILVTVQPAPSVSADLPRVLARIGGITVGGGTLLTVVAVGQARDTTPNGAGLSAYIDDITPPAAGQSRLRVINASPDAGLIDVHATLIGGALTVTPAFAGVVYRSALAQSLAPAQYVLTVTPRLNITTILGTAMITLVDGGVQTAVVRGFAGALPTGVGADRRIGITTMVNRAP